jgi:ABC-type spermidine/putrescine transport system permease subunit II
MTLLDKLTAVLRIILPVVAAGIVAAWVTRKVDGKEEA